MTLELGLPPDLPEGTYEAALCDASNSLRRRFRNEPHLLEPRDLDGVLRVVRLNTSPKRTSLYLHVPKPDRGLAVEGEALPSLPGSVRAAFGGSKKTPQAPVREDLIAETETPWVVEGTQSVRFTVVRDAELAR